MTRRAACIGGLLLLVPLAVMPAQGQRAKRITILEQHTATWCVFCSPAIDTAAAILGRMPDVRLIVHHHGDTMRHEHAMTLYDSLGLAITGLPSATIDRTLWQVAVSPPRYSFALQPPFWGEACEVMAADSAMLTITASGTYDTTTHVFSGAAQVHALQALQGTYCIHIVISEDSLNFSQSVMGVPTYPFYHRHTVRKLCTGPFGAQLTSNGFTANQTITFPFQDTLSASWVPRRCRLTVFVDRSYPIPYGHREIQQGFQEPLGSVFTFWPVQLAAFEALPEDGAVRLVWRTAAESSNRGWTVERRRVGDDWAPVGFVPGAGTTRQARAYEYLDRPGDRSVLYDYRLRQTDMNGAEALSPVLRVALRTPLAMRLHQAYPNPFNPSTEIAVEIPQASHLRLDVFDAVGRLVATLADGNYGAGYHPFRWTAVDARGRQLPGGVYFCRLTTSNGIETRRMQLQK